MLYSLATPLFEAPDEPWHYAYVRWLAEGHGLPRLDDDASGAYQEVAQPPLYYGVAALVSSPVADNDLPELFWHNPQFGYQASGTVNENKNMLIHTDRERFPWHGAVLAVRLARLVSLAFGLLTVGAAWGLAREAMPGRPALATMAAGAVAFTPQFLFISGVVNNDSATAATCTCALWALARIVRRGVTRRRAAVAGLALGLALLSKTSALLLLPLALLALWLSKHPANQSTCPGGVPTTRPGGVPIYKLTNTLLMLGLAGAVGGWWYLRNWILFNDPLGLSVHVDTPWGRKAPASFATLLSELPQVFRSFWGAFGWGHVELPGWLYVALGGLVGLAAVGWGRHLRRYRQTQVMANTSLTPISARICLLATLWYLAVLAALLRWMQQVEAPHGRLLFPALGAWGLLLAVGWSGLEAGRYSAFGTRYSVLGIRYSVFVPCIILLAVSLVMPIAVIRPAFAPPRLISAQEALRDVTPYTLDYDARARLLGYRVEPESVVAGGRVQVRLCWEGLRPMDQDYTLFIHLLGRGNLRVAERTTYPGQGRFPTSLWPVGRAFCDAYWLEVAAWAPAPELYALEVGLYDTGTGARLSAQDAAGQPLAPPAVGLVRVTPDKPPPPPAQALPHEYDLDGQIALVGYDGPPGLAAGEALTLTLYWQALQAPQGDYKVFVHLLDGTGALVTQDDTPPRGGRYPTWAWQPGDLVPDAHRLALPAELPPGPYHFVVGMYYPDTRVRLPVTGPEGPLADGVIPLMEFRDAEMR